MRLRHFITVSDVSGDSYRVRSSNCKAMQVSRGVLFSIVRLSSSDVMRTSNEIRLSNRTR
jgi:hypothetical protein